MVALLSNRFIDHSYHLERGWKKILLRSTIIVGRRRIKCTQPKTRPDKQLLQTTYSSLLLPPPTLSIPDCYRWLVMHMMLSYIMLNTLSYHISNRLFGMAYLICVINRAGSGQNPTRNLARGPWLLSGPTRPGPHYWRPVVARGNIFLARMAQI